MFYTIHLTCSCEDKCYRCNKNFNHDKFTVEVREYGDSPSSRHYHFSCFMASNEPKSLKEKVMKLVQDEVYESV